MSEVQSTLDPDLAAVLAGHALAAGVPVTFGRGTAVGDLAWALGEAQRARDEANRLRRGDFTPEEFQALCHHRDDQPGCTRADFEAGCREYQRKLFGPDLRPAPPTPRA